MSREENVAKVSNFFATLKQKATDIKCHENSKIKMLREFQVANYVKVKKAF